MSNKERYYILSRDAFTCQYCGRKAPEVELHVDHLIPVARGGNNERINLLTSCEDCNLSKQADLLPLNIIQEKQRGIIQRTNVYEKFLEEHPLEANTNDLSHRTEKPTSLLKRVKFINEPLKNRALNNKKRHVLKIVVQDSFNLSLHYGRLDVGGWVIEPIKKELDGQLRVLPIQHYEELNRSLSFEQMDEISGQHQVVYLYRNAHTGIHLVIVMDNEGVIPYAFYSPIKSLELAVEFASANDNFPSDDELEFYSS